MVFMATSSICLNRIYLNPLIFTVVVVLAHPGYSVSALSSKLSSVSFTLDAFLFFINSIRYCFYLYYKSSDELSESFID